MAELRARHPLEDVLAPGTHGTPASGGPGVTITDRRGLALVQVMTRRGRSAELAAALGIGAQPGRASVTDAFTALPVAPGQWMLMAGRGRDGAFAAKVRERAGDLAGVADQSHGRAVLRLRGPRARDVLAKGCPLDLHPRVFGPGSCAQTIVAQVGVLLHQIDDAPTCDLVVLSGYAIPFFEWLTASAAEFGYALEIEEPPGA